MVGKGEKNFVRVVRKGRRVGMPDCRRYWVPGCAFFFTNNFYSDLLLRDI